MKSRSGSALLVVLGMLSFMVVSGLAFAVYMRTTRLSSSFTRRTVTTRQLAKAALAEAIDQIDRAVANDPHPGVRNPYRPYYSMLSSGSSTSSGSSSGNPSATDFDPQKIDNVWSHRVLIGQAGDLNNLDSGVKVQVSDKTYYPAFVDPEDTTPVLSLEALAYLPPSIVNEVRYYGQRTPTAAWQSLDFDAGRFAFVAVDVSDFFDVNRFCAKLARSSDPLNRVTLGHVFENDLNHERSGSKVSDWENFCGLRRSITDSGLTFNSQLPFVSLADFNLALGTRVTAGGLKSPFYEYCNQSSSSGMGFYIVGENNDDYERYSMMNFVTDSLMATRPERESKTDAGDQILDLADDNNQIFKQTFLEKKQEERELATPRGVSAQLNSAPGSRLVQNRVPYVTMFALSDYLDRDRIPVTLAMPSVERVPMICGIKSNSSSPQVKLLQVFDADDPPNPPSAAPASYTVKRRVHWRIDPTSLQSLLGGFSVCVVYPFRNHEKALEDFMLDGKVQIFLSTKQMRLRTGNSSDLLHLGTQGAGDTAAQFGDSFVNNAVFNFPLQEKRITFDKVMDSPEDCVYNQPIAMTHDLTACLQSLQQGLANAAGDILCVTYQWTRNLINPANAGSTSITSADYDNAFASQVPLITAPNANVSILNGSGDEPTASFVGLDASGQVDTSFLQNISGAPGSPITFYLNVVPTIRIRSSDGSVLGLSTGPKTVDLVPAVYEDDQILNGIDNSAARQLFGDICGNPTPLMKFETSFTVNPQTTFSGSPAADTQNLSISPVAVMINDPRYNHAPENWIEQNFTQPIDWYNNLAKGSAQNQNNDGDIFMASSDQEYLQSVYEFAFLPRCSTLKTTGSSIKGNLGNYDGANWIAFGKNASGQAVSPPDANLMWKTYDIFGRNTDGPDDFEGLGLEYEGRGPRVNPYSNLDSVLMAAFANTPHDWRVASNNEDTNPAGSSVMDNADTFNKKHAWNQYSEGAKLSWAKLEDIAAQFYDRMRDGFSHPNNVTYSEDKDYAISGINDEYAPIWQDVFDSFFGNATGTDAEQWLCNVKLDDSKCSSVYSVDKKFLYGYWKSCFAARQQLYLVFFRAEPTMLGGGIAGVTPPQLGAKGVAVVWRDPYDPNERKSTGGTVTRYYPRSSVSANGDETYRPHQTRVLFYKQFE